MIRTVIVEDDDAAAELLAGYLDRYGGEEHTVYVRKHLLPRDGLAGKRRAGRQI